MFMTANLKGAGILTLTKVIIKDVLLEILFYFRIFLN